MVRYADEWISTQTDRQMCVYVCVTGWTGCEVDVRRTRLINPTDVCKIGREKFEKSPIVIKQEYDHNITLDVCFWHVIMLQIMILQAAVGLHFPVSCTDCC